MSKDSASVPLNNLSSSNPQHESKSSRSKKPFKYSLTFKLVVLVLICVLIALSIAVLIISVSKLNDKSCNSSISTGSPNVTHPPRVRTPNRFWNQYFLPLSMSVSHYELTLQLLNTTYNITKYNETNGFYGLVNIHLIINSQTNFVVLHAKNLTIHSMSVKEFVDSNQRSIDVNIVEIIYDDFYDYMILVLNRPLVNGTKCVVEIKYSGLMSYDDSGIISTTYYDLSKKKRQYILHSKLEPIGARRLFPCFDEPDKKTTFTVKIIHEEHFQTLSNMPLKEKQNIEFSQLLYSNSHWNQTLNLVTSEFQPTDIPMSIYLLAFVVMENYSYVENYREPNKLVRIWFPAELRQSAVIPLNYSSIIESFFERYFNYSNPLPKTDHIYIPDFLSGAMENWGLVTYRDQHLLVSEANTEQSAKISLMTIAHELAHFWFGNWITTKTWGEIWLNEGFATYFASVAYYKHISLDESTAEEVFLYERRQILNKDIRVPSPIIVNVTDPAGYKSVFNSMTYQKSQALLVWLDSIMGSNNFLKAIQNYIRRYAMKNPTNEQFFDCMEEFGPDKNDRTNISNLKSFFHPWLYKPGFPIVTVNYDTVEEKLILTQQSNQPNSSSTQKWPIHITYKASKTTDDVPVYFNDKLVLKKKLVDDEFVIINSNAKSYLRVNYSAILWDRIINDLKSSNSKINQINKIVLLDDAFSFLEQNTINISIAKDLINIYINETNTIPWLIFYHKIFDKIHEFFKDDILFDKFSSLVRKLSTNILRKTLKMNVDGKLNLIEDIGQQVIITMNCEINNDEVLNWVSNRFTTWIANPTATKLPKHLVKIILYYGLKLNDRNKYWMVLWKMFVSNEIDGPISYGHLAVGLAGTSKSYLLNKLLNKFLDRNTHRSNQNKYQDFLTTVEWMMKTTNGLVTLHRWIVRNSEKIIKNAFGHISRKEQIMFYDSFLGKVCKYIYEPHMIMPLLKIYRRASGLQGVIAMNSHWREIIGKKLIKFL